MAESENLVVRVTRRIGAEPNEVFDAWLDPDGMREWMCPGESRFIAAEVEPRVGGRFRIVMGREPGGIEHTGEYRELRRGQRLVFTWTSKNTLGRETLVTVELRPVGDETELTLTHEGLPNEEMRKGHEGGWLSIVDKLAAAMAR
jgi:uncharacterized protein YndB with AHSA1/START domain